MKLTIKTLHGLEDVLVEEVQALGGENIEKLHRAVSCEGDLRLLYRANLELRTAIRILVPIHTFRARNEHELYDKVKEIDWSEYMSVNDTLAIDGVTSGEIFRHSKYAALKTKDAIVDQFRDNTGKRPNVDVLQPSLRLNIYINNDAVTLSIDSSGESLHKRGYRVDVMEAPISEVLAAGMLLLAGWKGETDFIDPMCGSGTIPIEAALIATNTPAGIYRPRFAFFKWKNYDIDLWNEVQKDALAKVRPFEHKILATDSAFQAIRTTRRNVDTARMDKYIDIRRSKFERLEKPFETGLMIFNPPYDERLENEDIDEFYELIGDQLKANWKGFSAWLISSNMQALKNIGLRPSKKIVLFNGPLECKYQKFEMYAGSKKQKYQKKNEE